ncbi:hypothetical protein PV327_003594 [Microctonus hyperodae]|uniref:Uncharacterized protein n=1 Tax=Microctonus hyperodae TaxID=165561 RepID=A0AA39L1C6_MICHY|nr:hypothetical protein PV327_003594 [Microctonus hyperodae]
MEIDSEEFDVPEEHDEYNTINPFHSSIVIKPELVIMDDSKIQEAKEPKTYTPLNTVDYERVKSFGRTSSTPLIKSPLKNIVYECNSNNYNQSPRKLGATVSKRRHFGRLINRKKSQDSVEINLDNDNEMMEIDLELKKSISGIEDEQNEIPVTNLTQIICDNQHENICLSQEDMFAESQDNNESNEIIVDKNIENEYQEFTSLKIIKEKWKNTSMENDELLVSPKNDDRKSISSDSEFERVCTSIKSSNFDPGQFTFETMDLLDNFDDIDEATSNELISEMLGIPVVDQKNINEPLTDPLAISPKTQYKSEELNSSSIDERDNKRRKSIKKRKSRTKCETESKTEKKNSSTKIKLKKIKEKIKLVNEKGDTPETIKNKLENLVIKFDHEPLPQHQLETYISRPPSLNIKKLFVKYGPMKKGTFTESEDKTIIKNWERFCDIHDWNPDDSNSFLQVRFNRNIIINNEKHVKFTQFLAYGLPWRSLYSVYRRFQLLFTKKRKRGFTKGEDEKILIYLDNETKYSRKCQQLAKLLCRSQVSIRNRYDLLKGRNQTPPKVEKNVEWDVPLVEKFLKLLIELTLSDDVYDLKDAIIPRIVWKEMEKKMNISHDTMMRFWLGQLHLQLFYPRPLFENDIKIMLIEYMYVKGFSSKQDLIWHTIAQSFDGLTTYYLSRLFYSLVHNSPVRYEEFAYIIGWLYEKRIPQLTEKSKDRCLPRLIYEEGVIKIRKDVSTPSSPILSSVPSSLSPPPSVSSCPPDSPTFPSPND